MFFFVAPTKANLQQYEKWVTSAHQSEIFFGDLVEKCYRCTLKAGQTLFIPTGERSDVKYEDFSQLVRLGRRQRLDIQGQISLVCH